MSDVPVGVGVTYRADEGGSPVDVTVTLNPAPVSPVTIVLDATPRDGATDADWTGIPAELVFNAGDTSKTFSVTAVDDSDEDPGESVQLEFGNLPAGVTSENPSETTIELVDNDSGPKVTVSFSSDVVRNATESDGGLTVSASVTVEIDGDREQALTIPLSVRHRGGASAADYEGWPSSVRFEPDETEKTFLVAAVDDDDDDDEESLVLGFGASLPGSVIVGEHPRVTVRLHDNDGTETWYVTFEKASYRAVEGGAGAQVAVLLSEAWKPWRNEALTVPLFTPEPRGGASDADYSGVPESVTFQPGQNRATFTVTATDDSLDDDGESVFLQFRSGFPANLDVGGGPRTSTVHLSDNARSPPPPGPSPHGRAA